MWELTYFGFAPNFPFAPYWCCNCNHVGAFPYMSSLWIYPYEWCLVWLEWSRNFSNLSIQHIWNKYKRTECGKHHLYWISCQGHTQLLHSTLNIQSLHYSTFRLNSGNGGFSYFGLSLIHLIYHDVFQVNKIDLVPLRTSQKQL